MEWCQVAKPGTFVKGQKKPNQGKRGPAKATKALKEMILGALDAKGGQEWLEMQMDDQPAAFMTLIGKVLPTTLAGTAPDGSIAITVIRREIIG